MEKFNHIWWTFPIDFWENAIVAGDEEAQRVLSQMPEEPRDNLVFKTYMPWDGELAVIYMCKADNNGTIYLFSDENIFGYYDRSIEEVNA